MAIGRNEAAALDDADPLARFRDEFLVTRPEVIYMDGNSLGRLPRSAVDEIVRVAEQEWGEGLVASWEHWIDLPQRVGGRLAPLLGVRPHEVTLSDSTSVNLYKLAAAALGARPDRPVILTTSDNFPTDRYVLEGLAVGSGRELRVAEVDPVAGPTPEALRDALDEDVALVSLSHVSYRSAAIADMAAVDEIAAERGVLTLWDLSHSAGSVPIDLRGSGADLAVGCTYKYLNGGPGAPAFLWVRGELVETLRSPVWGWFGHADQFAFAPRFRPAGGLERFLVGTPPVLAMAAAGVGIDLAVAAGIDAIRAKSRSQTALMLDLYEAWLAPLDIGLGSPRSPERRGSHLAFRHRDGLAISRWLRARRSVVADFRAPDTIRMAASPLYTRYTEVWDAVDALREAVAEADYRRFEATGKTVT